MIVRSGALWRDLERRGIILLHAGTDGTQDDSKVQCRGLTPFVSDLVAQDLSLILVKLLQGLDGSRILRHEGTLPNEWDQLGHACALGKLIDLTKQRFLGDTRQWVFDPMDEAFSTDQAGEEQIDLRKWLDRTYLAVTLLCRSTDFCLSTWA